MCLSAMYRIPSRTFFSLKNDQLSLPDLRLTVTETNMEGFMVRLEFS